MPRTCSPPPLPRGDPARPSHSAGGDRFWLLLPQKLADHRPTVTARPRRVRWSQNLLTGPASHRRFADLGRRDSPRRWMPLRHVPAGCRMKWCRCSRRLRGGVDDSGRTAGVDLHGEKGGGDAADTEHLSTTARRRAAVPDSGHSLGRMDGRSGVTICNGRARRQPIEEVVRAGPTSKGQT